jgi:hypothetical protein
MSNEFCLIDARVAAGENPGQKNIWPLSHGATRPNAFSSPIFPAMSITAPTLSLYDVPAARSALPETKLLRRVP